jgi:hypothetical protein
MVSKVRGQMKCELRCGAAWRAPGFRTPHSIGWPQAGSRGGRWRDQREWRIEDWRSFASIRGCNSCVFSAIHPPMGQTTVPSLQDGPTKAPEGDEASSAGVGPLNRTYPRLSRTPIFNAEGVGSIGQPGVRPSSGAATWSAKNAWYIPHAPTCGCRGRRWLRSGFVAHPTDLLIIPVEFDGTKTGVVQPRINTKGPNCSLPPQTMFFPFDQRLNG